MHLKLPALLWCSPGSLARLRGACCVRLFEVYTYCRLTAASGYLKAKDHSGCGNDLPLISPPIHSKATITSGEVGEICLLLSNACCPTSSRRAGCM